MFEGLIRAGDVVVCAQASSEPCTLTEALMHEAAAIGPITVFLGATFSETFRPHPCIRYAGIGGIGNTHRVSRQPDFQLVRAPYSGFAPMFASGELRCDVVLLSIAGESVGPTCDWAIDAARRARVVIAESNDRMPQPFGTRWPAEIRPQQVVQSSRALPALAVTAPSTEERAIAAHVARLVPHGATIELGVGGVADAVAAALASHRDLRVHTGILTESVLPLFDAGVIVDRAVAGMVVGGPALYAFADRNPRLAVCDTSRTHDAAVLARIERFHAINGAIEVDLAGNVNAETANGAYVGGLGGLPDFATGAQRSAGGRSIIALTATARRGAVSRIVRTLEREPTLPGVAVDFVVTEWGVAELRGATAAERAARLAAIAHPAFRGALSAA